MTRFTRMIATRLRRFANPRRTASLPRTAAAEAWTRLEAALAAQPMAAATAQRREQMLEGTRLSITLIGQQGRGAVARILASCDGDLHEGGEAARIAMTVAVALGHAGDVS